MLHNYGEVTWEYFFTTLVSLKDMFPSKMIADAASSYLNTWMIKTHIILSTIRENTKITRLLQSCLCKIETTKLEQK